MTEEEIEKQKEDSMFWARVDKLQGKTCKCWK